MGEEVQSKSDYKSTNDATNCEDAIKNSIIVAFAGEGIIPDAKFMNVAAWASEEEGCTYTVKDGPTNCQDVLSSYGGIKHQESSCEVDGIPKSREDHLPLL